MDEMEKSDPTAGVDLGRPGASARAEFERRRRRDAQRRRHTFGRLLAPLVAALVGERPSTARWGLGGAAEEYVGRLLSDAVGTGGVVLHDRAVPSSRTNLDHVAVVPSGIWVIDTKRYRGVVRRARPPGRPFARRTLVVNGHDRSHLAAAARRQGALVQAVAGPDACVRPVLCFAGSDRRPPFVVRGVLVTCPAALARSLTAPGTLDAVTRAALVRRLARAFPACAVPGPRA